ncbi:MAG: DNA polymerase IV, partial [Myxococcales bacterium]|nr:DNA polymerase IV [Myxococcales bacterium]
MSMAVALRRCPDAIVVPPRFERYKELSGRVMEVFSDFSPAVEALSLDEAFLEMSGAERLFGTPHEMGRELKRRVVEATGGLTVSVGVANTKYVAKVASDYRKPDGLTVVRPDQVFEFLDPLPIDRLWGVGKTTAPKIERLGYRRIGDIRHAEPALLKQQLGSLGAHIYVLANNLDSRPVRSHRGAKSVGYERTLSDDIVGAAAIRPHLLEAAKEVGRRLRKKSLMAGGVRVKLKTAEFQLHTRQKRFEQPTDLGKELFEGALELLKEFELNEPLRLVGVTAYDLLDGSFPVQTDLFESNDRQRSLERTLDEIAQKFGD